jgi:hypothetical protein
MIDKDTIKNDRLYETQSMLQGKYAPKGITWYHVRLVCLFLHFEVFVNINPDSLDNYNPSALF